MSTDLPTPDDEVGDGDEAGGGHFTAAGRRAALNASLPLLATYFSNARTWDLEISPQLGSTDDDRSLNDLAASARLRASLAAADRLLRILGEVSARPTFRYTQVNAESVGAIRGRLDLARYSRQQGRITVPRRYPVRLVKRENATPENVLLGYAVLWLRRDLDATPRRLIPSGGPEDREKERLEDALKGSLGRPLLDGTKKHAENVWRQSSIDSLLDRVNQRIMAGHVARPEPYEKLVDWMTATRRGSPVAEVGDREWSFYDQRFDPTLFEVWCLQCLSQAMTALLGEPVRNTGSLAARSDGPMFGWQTGVGTLNLHFQPSLRNLTTGGTRWSYHGNGGLRGSPDFAVTANTIHERSVTLLDAKLRQRRDAPSEEIYKLLGYFSNLDYELAPTGAILYYSPGKATDYKLTSVAGGEVHALGLDPESTDPQPFITAAEIALRAAGLGDDAIALLRAPGPKDATASSEHTVSVRQAVAVETMQRAASTLPAESLAPTRKHTATTLRAIWGHLNEQTRTMIVTAEYFANTAPDDADHSGPLLGLAAAFERVLNDEIFNPAAARSPGTVTPGQTLGGCLRTLQNALSGRFDKEARAVASVLDGSQSADTSRLRALLGDAKAMNRTYRIPAAHAEVVSATTWAEGREAILDPGRGLLSRLISALGTPARSTVAQ